MQRNHDSLRPHFAPSVRFFSGIEKKEGLWLFCSQDSEPTSYLTWTSTSSKSPSQKTRKELASPRPSLSLGPRPFPPREQVRSCFTDVGLGPFLWAWVLWGPEPGCDLPLYPSPQRRPINLCLVHTQEIFGKGN